MQTAAARDLDRETGGETGKSSDLFVSKHEEVERHQGRSLPREGQANQKFRTHMKARPHAEIELNQRLLLAEGHCQAIGEVEFRRTGVQVPVDELEVPGLAG